MPLLIDTNYSRRNRYNNGGQNYDSPYAAAPIYRQPRRNVDDGYSAPLLSQRPGVNAGGTFGSGPSYPAPPLTPNLGATLANRFGQHAQEQTYRQNLGSAPAVTPIMRGPGPIMAPSTQTLPAPSSVQPYADAPMFHPGIQMPVSLLGGSGQQDEGIRARQATPGPTISTPGYMTGPTPTPSAPGPNYYDSAPNVAARNSPRTLQQYQDSPQSIMARRAALDAGQQTSDRWASAPYDTSQLRQNDVVAAGSNESASRANLNNAQAENLPAATEAVSAQEGYKRLSAENAQIMRENAQLRSQLGMGERQAVAQEGMAARQQTAIANRPDRGNISPGLELNRELGGVYTDPESGEMHFKNYPKIPMGDAVDQARAAIKAGKAPTTQQAAPATQDTKAGKALDENTAKQLLQEAGGDKAKARQLAQQRGYSMGE